MSKIQSTYLSIPLIVKFYGEYFNNIRSFVTGGVGYAFNLESKIRQERR